MVRGLLLPFAYHAQTRLPNWPARLSWLALYGGGQLVALLAWGGALDASPTLAVLPEGWLPTWLLSLIALDLIYGNGYLQNDIDRVEQEENPTERLSPAQKSALQPWLRLLVKARGALALACIVGIDWLQKPLPGTPPTSMATTMVVLLVFALAAVGFLFIHYNHPGERRGRALSFLLLTVLRWYVPLLPLAWATHQLAAVAVAVLLAVAVPRTLELSRKFRLPFGEAFSRSPDTARVLWLGSLLLLISLGNALFAGTLPAEVWNRAGAWVAYLLAIRLLGWGWVKWKGEGSMSRNSRYFGSMR
jgi:hypothetical protein